MVCLTTRKLAAIVLSKALTDHGIRHAFIGSFAVTEDTNDIDVEIDLPSDSLCQRVKEATADDARFQQQGLQLIFHPRDTAETDIFIETLPAGDVGFPRRVVSIPVGHGTLPVLPPEILVLTKMKRRVYYLGSEHPMTVDKFVADGDDILRLLGWLVEKNKKIDFTGYHSPLVERLYAAVQVMALFWKSNPEYSAHLELLDWALSELDKEIVFKVL